VIVFANVTPVWPGLSSLNTGRSLFLLHPEKQRRAMKGAKRRE